MFKNSAIRVASVGIIAAALVGATAMSAQAAEPVPTVGSTGPYYLIDSGTGAEVPAGTVMHFDTDVSGNPTKENPEFDLNFTGPADATDVYSFIAPRGQERNPAAWVAFSLGGFQDPAAKTVLMPPAKYSSLINGPLGANGVKNAGGNYSLGMAFTKSNGVQIASDAVYYSYITVTAGSGDWQYAVPTTVTPPQPASGEFDANLQATTLQAVDGTLNLVAPATDPVIIGSPVLDPITHLSTSTGSLGKFTVQDGRVVTHKGWTLTTSVTDFTNSADSSVTIDKKQLGIAPLAATGTTLPAGVTLAAVQVAGSATNPAAFAEADATQAIASTDLDAGLTFVAPADKPAGTYTSKLTVTLASK
jgi:hypothetical protein